MISVKLFPAKNCTKKCRIFWHRYGISERDTVVSGFEIVWECFPDRRKVLRVALHMLPGNAVCCRRILLFNGFQQADVIFVDRFAGLQRKLRMVVRSKCGARFSTRSYQYGQPHCT